MVAFLYFILFKWRKLRTYCREGLGAPTIRNGAYADASYLNECWLQHEHQRLKGAVTRIYMFCFPPHTHTTTSLCYSLSSPTMPAGALGGVIATMNSVIDANQVHELWWSSILKKERELPFFFTSFPFLFLFFLFFATSSRGLTYLCV